MVQDLSLPDGWTWTTVGDITDRVTKGSTPTSYGFQYRQQGIRFVKTENIKEDGTIQGITDFIDDEANQFLSRSILQASDILFSIAGTIGRVGMVQEKDIPANTNQALAILRGVHKKANSKYVFYYLKSPLIQKQALKSIVGVGRANVSLSNVSSFEIPLPPLPEQERIVERIESLFTQLEVGVAGLKRAQVALKRYKASVLKAACEGRLVPQEAGDESAEVMLRRILAEKGEEYRAPEGELGELPRGWVWARVSDFAIVGTGATPLRSKAIYWENASIPWITSGALNALYVFHAEEFITDTALKETNVKIFPSGTLLVAMYGEGKTRGKVSELMLDATTNQACAALVFDGVAAQCKPYVKLFFRKNYEDIRRLSSGGVQPNLNLSIIKNTYIPLPSLSEQHRIVAEVERWLSVVQELEGTIEANLRWAGRLRQAVLKRAFEGRLV